jgi:PKD repeat protein
MALGLAAASALAGGALAGSGSRPARQTEAVETGDFTCGTSLENTLAFHRRLALPDKATTIAAGDHDLHHIAVLEDKGDLILFQGGRWVTDSETIAMRFYQSHADDFDYIAIFAASTFPLNVFPEGGFAFESNIANDITGINLPIFNTGSGIWPGVRRLRSLLNMNDLGEYNEDPSEELPRFRNVFSGVDVMGQEAHHMVAAFTNVFEKDILGRGESHWSYFMQTYGSVMEGNDWESRRDGSFMARAAATGFSQLDLYLYGYLSHEQVTDPMFVIQEPFPDLAQTGGDASTPTPGVQVYGAALPVTIDDIILTHGIRSPDPSQSQKVHRMAWILVVPMGTAPSPHDLEKIDDFRVQWQEWFHAETLGLGRMESEIGPDPVVAGFESRLRAGAPGLTVRFDNDSFGSIDAFEWDFGDGNVSSERHPTHTYVDPGNYAVTLRVLGVGGPVEARREAYVRVGDVVSWFHDDFETNLGWQVGSTVSMNGVWERGEPFGSYNQSLVGGSQQRAWIQPDEDHTPTGSQCWVTGNLQVDNVFGDSDIDDGITTLTSPRIDLSQATDPFLSFWHWFTNNAGTEPGRDSLRVDVSIDDGASWQRVLTFRSSHHSWREEQVRLLDHVSAVSDRVRIRFEVGDEGEGSIVEASIDDVSIFDVGITQTPVQIADLAATSAPTGVLLAWSLSADAVRELRSVGIQRAPGVDGPWSDIAGVRLTPEPAMSYVDETAVDGESYGYRLVLDVATGVELSRPVTVAYRARAWSTALAQPHVDAGGVTVRYTLASSGPARLDVFDVAGRRVHVLADGVHAAGAHAVRWDRTVHGDRAARGVYVVRLSAGRDAVSRKLILR